jgi:hypothetical protein
MSGAGVGPSLAPSRAGVDETNRVILGNQTCGAYDGTQQSNTDQQMSFRSR